MTPKGWKKKTIGDLCEFVNGNGFKASEWSDKGLPIIRIQNLNGSREFNYFDGKPKKSWIVMPGQLLFAWAGTKGVSFGPTIWNGPKGVLNQHIYKVKVSEDVDPIWFYKILRRTTDIIERRAHGFKATLVHVKKADITDQVVLVPNRNEQSKIAQTLTSWDEAIETTEKLIANSKAQKKALMQQLLTGKSRFQKYVASEFHFKTRYGSIPRDWNFVSIGDVANEVSERNSGGENYPVLSCSKYAGFVNSLEYFNKKVYSDDLTNYKLVRKGGFGFPSNHIEEGSIGYQDICDCGVVSPIYTVFRTADEVVDGYLYKLLKTEHYRQIFAANTNSSVDRRGSLRWSEFSHIRIPLPGKEEQLHISGLIDLADQQIKNLEVQHEALSNQKKAIMQQLLTGKRRVKLDSAA